MSRVDGKEINRVVRELLRMPAETAKHREAISQIAVRRRELAAQLGGEVGPSEAAKLLGISRQTFWQVLNPTRAKEIKRRSRTGRRSIGNVDQSIENT